MGLSRGEGRLLDSAGAGRAALPDRLLLTGSLQRKVQSYFLSLNITLGMDPPRLCYYLQVTDSIIVKLGVPSHATSQYFD